MPTAFHPRNDVDRPSPAAHGMWWRVAAAVTVLACAFLHWHVARDAIAPRTPWDENHVLQMARFLSGDANVTHLSGAGYYPGWSFIMAPIWWFTHDAQTVYLAAIVLGNVIAVATIVPLALTARHLGLTMPQAITAGALVMCLPGRTVNADYVLAEKPMMFFLAWAVLAAIAVWRRPSWWRMTLFVLAVTATYFVHARALTVVITAAVWLVCYFRRSVLHAVLGLALLGAGSFAVREISAWVHQHVLISRFSQGELLFASLTNATPVNLARMTLSQTWAQLAGTAGLFGIGIAVILIWAWRELRTLRVGVGGMFLGLTLVTVFVSIISWADSPHLAPMDGVRFDASVYTRYIDPVATILALVAIAALIRGLSRPVIAATLAVSAVVSALVVYWVAPTVPTWGNLDGPANAAAILPWDRVLPTGQPFDLPLIPTFTNENRFWLFATAFLLVALASYLLLRATPRVLVVLLLVTLAVLTREANQTQLRDYPGDITAAVEDVERRDSAPDPVTIDMDVSCRDSSLGIHQAINWLPYWLSPRVVELVDLDEGEHFDSELVVSCDAWPRAEEFGALAYDGGATDYGYRLWVLPGALQDDLDEQGVLVSPQELDERRAAAE
jgi:hypothetical protein